MEIHPTPKQMKSLPTRGIFNNPKLWLEQKSDFDVVLHEKDRSNWVVDNKIYDLSNFVEKHPGGAHWLQRTRGHNITELFYTHHLNEAKAKEVLAKYYVGDCKNEFTRFTFKSGDFYQVLKGKILAQYTPEELQDNKNSQILAVKILLVFLFFFLLTCYTQSYIAAAITGFVLVGVVGEGHNFMHQRLNAYRYMFVLTGFTHEDWQNFHAISHHMHPNTELDYEIAAFEPVARFLRNQKQNPPYIELLMQPFFFLMVPLNMTIKILQSIIKPNKFNIGIIFPFWEVIALYVFNNDWFESFKLFFFIQACFGFSLTKCIFCGHRVQDTWTAGCEPISDFAEHTLATTCDTTTYLTGFLSMMLFAGFNQHIAHHLFPTIDHYHLSKITPLVKETAKEFNVQYRCKSKWECMVSISKAMVRRIPFVNKK